MAKSRKRRKKISKRKNTATTKDDFLPEIYDIKFLFPDEDNKKEYDTPFGPLITHEGMLLLYGIKNKKAFFNILNLEDDLEVEDKLETLVQYEKLKSLYPKEPYFHHEVAACYLRLEKVDKYLQLTQENYEKFAGYPLIDLSYAELSFQKEKGIEKVENIFKNKSYLHDIYPTYQGFESDFVNYFYQLLAKVYIQKQEYEIATKCTDIVQLFDKEEAKTLYTTIDFHSAPEEVKKKRRIQLKLILAIFTLLILGAIIGIIWGIVKLFKWIF